MRSRITPLSAALCLAWLLLPQPLPAATSPALPPITVKVLPGTDASIFENLVNIRPVAKGPATLQFDLAHQHILDAQGQVVVDVARNNPISLQGTVDKWRYAAAFSALSATHPQPMRTDWGKLGPRPGPQPHLYDGEDVDFVMSGVPASRQMVVFSFDASATLSLLYAPGMDDTSERSGDTLIVSAIASAPFGVDHIIAISAADPDHIQALAVWIAESARAHGMLDTQGSIFQQIAALRDVRVGVLSVYTCKSASNCNR
jgi:hypothetical protein